MANETPVAPMQDSPTVKSIASNIVKGIQDKSNGKSAPAKAETPAVVDPNAGKEKYVVNGKEIWLTPEQQKAYVQKGIAFEPRVTQLGHLQNEVAEFMKTLSNDPLKILTDKRIGLTPEVVLEKIFSMDQVSDSLKEKVGKWYWDRVVQLERMTPEQREAYESKRKLSEYERREVEMKETSIRRDNELRVQQALDIVKAQIRDAMKESGLPSNDTPLGAEMARMVADVMRVAYFQRQAITPKQAIEKVRLRIKEFQSSFYDSLTEDELVKEIGETNAEKVKKYFLKLAKEAGKEAPAHRAPSTARNGERKTMNEDDFRDYLEKRKKEG